MPVSKTDDPEHKSDSVNEPGRIEALSINGAQSQLYLGRYSETGHTRYEVDVPPPDDEDKTCLIVVNITGSLEGTAWTDWAGADSMNPACHWKSLVEGKLWSSLCDEKAKLDLESSDEATDVEIERGDTAVKTTVKVAGGKLTKSAAYECSAERKRCYWDFTVTAEGSTNILNNDCIDGFGYSQLEIEHQAEINAYHVKNSCDRGRETVFTWDDGRYTERSDLDREYEEKLAERSERLDESASRGEHEEHTTQEQRAQMEKYKEQVSRFASRRTLDGYENAMIENRVANLVEEVDVSERELTEEIAGIVQETRDSQVAGETEREDIISRLARKLDEL